ncbi:glycosyltransferase family 4 protein [Chlorobaculum sp. MV4-Y]|jgi:glycosyltransferase involved in cell wall biosynthesis|uniref:glycosyltransferase family 4 protein n=1 Tax=Chlorobaculum sp. MV4-Y TaxID=2976335 RepID=UPI0021AFEFD8|nr:glycosyltransferase family 4 protein [Chlorobaculum sp. MV4-Y]UWX57856.1 glycosyltransferase family 4 protein [Chlorobaculum sp. MV4-Y]
MIRILCLHLAENQASYRYRVEQFLPYWKEYGIDMQPLRITSKSYPEKLSIALRSGEYDYVWLQRKPLSPLFTSIIARNTNLIYDYDDALYAVESYRKTKPKPTQPGSKQTIQRLNMVLKCSSLVFAGSHALSEYASRFNPENTFIIPTAYQKLLEPPSPKATDETVTIGWIGNTGNLYFLSKIDEAAFAIQSRFPDSRFSVMSGKAPEGLKTKWEFVKWSKEGESAWLDSIDIGIMPLEDDEWSRGKCAFKLLQYMAHGKPVVASRVGANIDAVIHGNSGFLAASEKEWEAAFETLVSNPEERLRMGEKSLEHFLSTYEREQVQQRMATILHEHYKQHAYNR